LFFLSSQKRDIFGKERSENLATKVKLLNFHVDANPSAFADVMEGNLFMVS
jgi:hypothetical protein